MEMTAENKKSASDMEKEVKYPIGQQDFKTLRKLGYIYVDKTRFVHKVTRGSQYLFLARPRRFGKSLFLSTLRYFFEGERDLFKGLYIDSTDWKWEHYPVLRLDLNVEKYSEPGKLDSILNGYFSKWEEEYDVTTKESELSLRFRNIIEAAHRKTGQQVVILVDEYDKPLVGNLNKIENLEHYREKLASVYANFKSSAEHIRLVFLTGVSRFSKLSVFSDLNNLDDITFDNAYADICGITEQEFLETFPVGINKLAREKGISYSKAVSMLKSNYDGYRFAAKGSDIYNPWSLLSCLDKSEIRNFWNQTGQPSIIAETLKRIDVDLKEFLHQTCSADELRGQDLLDPRPIALLYQTGYLTIKKYNERRDMYTLGLPNKEVKQGFFDALLPYYVSTKGNTPQSIVSRIVNYAFDGAPQKLMLELQVYFAGVSYKMRLDNENNFHNAFFLLTNLIGLDTHTEVSTSDGSIDILISTDDFIYIIELKYDRPAEEALRQINNKHYDRPYLTDGRKIFKIGVSFSSKTRCIENWIIEAEG